MAAINEVSGGGVFIQRGEVEIAPVSDLVVNAHTIEEQGGSVQEDGPCL